MILLIDNYDSFVFNLERYFRRLGQATLVVRNDAVDVESIRRSPPTAIVFSPGPCAPAQAGQSVAVAAEFAPTIPMLGVCLGHQIIAEAHGGAIVRSSEPMHGRTSPIDHDGMGVFDGVPKPFTVCRYHSLVVARDSLPQCLVETATARSRSGNRILMAFRHRLHPSIGLQFHPEAILTEYGFALLRNFLRGIGVDAPVVESELPSRYRTELANDDESVESLSRPITF